MNPAQAGSSVVQAGAVFLQIVWRSEAATVTEPVFTAKAVLVSNAPNPITTGQIVVYLNEQALPPGQKDLIVKPLRQSQSGRYDWQQTLPLREGQNEIVLGLTLPGQAEARSESLIVRYLAPAKPNLYVLAIGVSGNGLQYAADDAEQLGQLLDRQEGRLFDQVQTVYLNKPGQTTAKQLRTELILLTELGITPADVLVVFASSHGKKINLPNNKTDFALLPEDYDARTGGLEEISTLRYRDHIMANLTAIDCKKLILLDACHSGEAVFQQGGKSRYLADLKQAQQLLKQTPPGLVLLTSSSDGQVSWEDPAWQHGAFTKALLDGLGGAADLPAPATGRKDGFVSVSELFAYLRQTVPPLVKGRKNEPQEPQMFPASLPADRDFPLVQY